MWPLRGGASKKKKSKHTLKESKGYFGILNLALCDFMLKSDLYVLSYNSYLK